MGLELPPSISPLLLPASVIRNTALYFADKLHQALQVRGTLLSSSALGTKTGPPGARERTLHAAANATISYLLYFLYKLTAALGFASCLVKSAGVSCG